MRINNLTYIEAKGRKFRLKTWSNTSCWIELRKDNQWWFYSGSLADERSDIKNSAKFYEVDENAHEIKPYPRYYRHTNEKLYKFLNPTTAILLLPSEKNMGNYEIGDIFYDCISPEENSSYTSLAIGSVAGYSPEPGSEKYFQFWNEIAKHEDVYTHVISQDIQVENGYRIDAFLNRTSAEEDVQEWVTGKSSVTDKVCSIFEFITKNDKQFLINSFSVLEDELSEHLHCHIEESKRIIQTTGLSNADLQIAHQHNCENNNIQQNKKRENKMSNNKKHVEEAAKVLANALCENTAEPKRKLTDMEANAGYAYLAIAYNRDGEKLIPINFEKKKDAKQWLQQPENIGKTLVLYTIDKTLTTNIPVVEIK